MLADAGQQEYLVVHREPEQDREQERRYPGRDVAQVVEAQERVAPSPLEHHHEHAVCGDDRQQRHHHGFERQKDRPEQHHQHEERQQHHQCDDARQILGDGGGEVPVLAGGAADQDAGVAQVRGGGDDLVLDPGDEVLGLGGVLGECRDDMDELCGPVVGLTDSSDDRDRRVATDRRNERVHPGLCRRDVASVDDDPQGRERAWPQIPGDRDRCADRRGVTRQRCGAARTEIQPERGDREREKQRG